MYSDSRKAQYNSFAHHRASMLFFRPRAELSDKAAWIATAADAAPGERAKAMRDRVVAGLRGFTPANALAAQ